MKALADALVQLGISPVYHMREVGKNKHQAAWVEAIEAKYEDKGEPYGREQFDKLLGAFEVGTEAQLSVMKQKYRVCSGFSLVPGPGRLPSSNVPRRIDQGIPRSIRHTHCPQR